MLALRHSQSVISVILTIGLVAIVRGCDISEVPLRGSLCRERW